MHRYRMARRRGSVQWLGSAYVCRASRSWLRSRAYGAEDVIALPDGGPIGAVRVAELPVRAEASAISSNVG